MDGVPGISFDGIAPGATFTYRFSVQQAGTYWYHSHSGFQEQTGVYGALVIDPLEPEPFGYEREYVVMLSDWTDEDPQRIFARLKKHSDYYNFQQRTLADAVAEIRQRGWAEQRSERRMWNRMRMSDRDLADVTGAAYTYLVNGRPPAQPWEALFERGERIRLRIVNGSAMTIFDLRIPGLPMTIVTADGHAVEPVTVDEMRIGVAETYDVIVAPQSDAAYALFAQAIDRSGFALGSLTSAAGLRADVPRLDPVPSLSHADMGMAMAGGDEIAHSASTQSDSMPHMPGMPGMPETAPTGGDAGDDKGGERRGPEIDMRAASPQSRLDDPGVGLRDRPWRVLRYADLRFLGASPDPREPSRELELHLTGNMARYLWSFDGVRASSAEPIGLRLGERLRVTLVNDTMMNHPIHLHGMWSDVETGDERRLPRKHTVLVQPGQRLSYRVTADAPGPWAYHCHLLYHMEAGMFRVVTVS